MLRMTGNKGFTVIELLLVIVVVGVLVIGIGFYGGICKGNFWVGEESALKAIQRIDPTIVSVFSLERYIWGYSKVVAIDKNGDQREFSIDANILQNRRAIARTK